MIGGAPESCFRLKRVGVGHKICIEILYKVYELYDNDMVSWVRSFLYFVFVIFIITLWDGRVKGKSVHFLSSL